MQVFLGSAITYCELMVIALQKALTEATPLEGLVILQSLNNAALQLNKLNEIKEATDANTK